MLQPIKEKRSPFIERWSQAERINARLGLTVMVLTILCAVLTMTTIHTALKPRPIYYIPSPLEAGIAYPQQAPEFAVSLFSASWVLNFTNFTPATVVDVYARAQKFMSPRFLSRTKGRLKNDIDMVKQTNMSSLLSLQGEPSIERQGNTYKVSIKGDKGVFAGKELIASQSMLYHLTLRRVSPTDNNPYGLLIDDIDQEISRGDS